MTPREMELMRTLTAAQAALWEVIDNPESAMARVMFSAIMARLSRLGKEITEDGNSGGQG